MTDAARIRAYLSEHSMPVPFSGCHLWLRAPGSSGYGAAWFDGRREDAHVLALRAKLGRELAPGMLAQHSCDERMCCNEDHLSEGTKASNGLDAARKLRCASTLTAEQVLRIRVRLASGATCRGLAREHGVSKTAIQKIRDRETWVHLPLQSTYAPEKHSTGDGGQEEAGGAPRPDSGLRAPVGVGAPAVTGPC